MDNETIAQVRAVCDRVVRDGVVTAACVTQRNGTLIAHAGSKAAAAYFAPAPSRRMRRARVRASERDGASVHARVVGEQWLFVIAHNAVAPPHALRDVVHASAAEIERLLAS